MADDIFSGGSRLERPRWRALVNGRPFACFAAEVQSTSARQAARGTIRIALSPDDGVGADWWAGLDQPDCEVQAAMLPDGADEGSETWVSLWMGAADHLHLDTFRGTVELEGRDYLAKLLDAKTRETFANKSASEVVQILAARHGFTADVTPTRVLVGQYLKLEHDRTTLDSTARTTTEGELLFRLAREENYDVWMTGKTLHFHPAVNIDTSDPVILSLTPRSDDNPVPVSPVTDIVYDRSYALAKDIKVVIKSWNSHHKASSETVYPPGAAKGAQVYTFVRPNLTPAQATKEAQSLYMDIIKHERIVQVTMPGELKLTAQAVVRLVGTGTGADGFEQIFYVDEISREFAFDSGFQQHVRLKNHSAASEPNAS